MVREPSILSADSPVSRASTPLIVLSRAPCAGALGPLWEGGSSSPPEVNFLNPSSGFFPN